MLGFKASKVWLNQSIGTGTGEGQDGLNLTDSDVGVWIVRGRTSMLTFMNDRAFAGRRPRNDRADFAWGEKGLNVADTSVRNRVIIAAGVVRWRGRNFAVLEGGIIGVIIKT